MTQFNPEFIDIIYFRGQRWEVKGFTTSIWLTGYLIDSFGALQVKYGSGYSYDDTQTGASGSKMWKQECIRHISRLSSFQGEDGKGETLYVSSDRIHGVLGLGWCKAIMALLCVHGVRQTYAFALVYVL